MISIEVNKKLFTASGEMNLQVATELPAHGFTAISGASGSGKTTLLNMIGGISEPKDGHIEVNGEIWFDKKNKINLPVHKRSIGMVFQDYALFPNMTIRQNINYASVSESYTDHLIEMLELGELAGRNPGKLSGGQKQRAAIARALARKPKLLLMDEPLSALDEKLRRNLENELEKIYQELNIPVIMVSHDLATVFRLAEKSILMNNGIIERQGSPMDVFLDQKTSNKFSFCGTVLKITKTDIVYTAVVAVGERISEVILTESDIKGISPGDKILIASKAFQPIIRKLNQ